VFSGNTVVEGGDRTWNVKGITTNGSKLYMAYKNSSDNHLVEFGNHNGPIFKRIINPLAYNYECDGNMAYIGNNIIVSTKNGSNVRVYKFNTSTSTLDSLLSDTTTNYEITAMCPYNSTYCITALNYRFMGVMHTRIYKSTSSDLFSHEIYDEESSSVPSVTALAVTGSTLIFAADESDSTRIYSGSIPSSGEISTTKRETLYYDVTGLTYKSSTLMTAVQEGTTTKIYSGTTSDPLGTLRETYTTTNLLALESDSEFIFMVKDNTGDDDEERTVYFTDTTTNMDDDII